MIAGYEAVTTDRIMYQRGTICQYLEGFHAWLYRAMIKRYGKADATERFWWLWHKKKEAPTATTTKRLELTYND